MSLLKYVLYLSFIFLQSIFFLVKLSISQKLFYQEIEFEFFQTTHF